MALLIFCTCCLFCSLAILALNISLLQDYLKQRREAQEAAEAEAAKLSKGPGFIRNLLTKADRCFITHLSYLKGKSALGELDFPVNEVYYFTVEDRFYYAESIKEPVYG